MIPYTIVQYRRIWYLLLNSGTCVRQEPNIDYFLAQPTFMFRDSHYFGRKSLQGVVEFLIIFNAAPKAHFCAASEETLKRHKFNVLAIIVKTSHRNRPTQKGRKGCWKVPTVKVNGQTDKPHSQIELKTVFIASQLAINNYYYKHNCINN